LFIVFAREADVKFFKKLNWKISLACLLSVCLLFYFNWDFTRRAYRYVKRQIRSQLTRVYQGAKKRVKKVRRTIPRKTVDDRLQEYGEMARLRMEPYFASVGIDYPPQKVVLVGIKDQRNLEVWVENNQGKLKYLRSYPILGASGVLGPKLRQGDCQVPEGIYGIGYLNPNSRYHVSMQINYPNLFDQRMAALEGRTGLGGAIMIHGGRSSIGCLAMGDSVSEELFVLVAESDWKNAVVILTPVDFRTRELPEDMPPLPEWIDELYEQIRIELLRLKN
jgi:hypothetical protein